MSRLMTCCFVVVCLSALSAPVKLWAVANGTDRPFHGRAEGMVVSTIPPNGLVIDAGGTASHLGRFLRQETLFLNPDGTFHGSIVFVAANGDQLNCDVTGEFTSPTDASGSYVFTGGTGRFAGATGTAVFAAFTPDGIHVSAQFHGRLFY